MSTDFTKIQMASSASSNKVLKEGSGTFNVSALGGAGETFGSATIAHGFSTDNLLYQVAARSDTVGALIDETVLPWSSNDNRINMYARIDSTNLYIYCISSDSSGLGAPARTISYAYRVLIP